MPEGGFMRNRRSSGALQWSGPAYRQMGCRQPFCKERGFLGAPLRGLIEAALADGFRLAMVLDECFSWLTPAAKRLNGTLWATHRVAQ